MDEKLKQVQEAFILSYVRKQRRERLSYELNSDKKRYEGLERFCHQAEDLLDPCRIILSGTDLFKRKEFLTFIEKHRKEDCFLLSPDAAFSPFSTSSFFFFRPDAMNTFSWDSI